MAEGEQLTRLGTRSNHMARPRGAPHAGAAPPWVSLPLSKCRCRPPIASRAPALPPHTASIDVLPPDVLELIANRVLADVCPFYDGAGEAGRSAGLADVITTAARTYHQGDASLSPPACAADPMQARVTYGWRTETCTALCSPWLPRAGSCGASCWHLPCLS